MTLDSVSTTTNTAKCVTAFRNATVHLRCALKAQASSGATLRPCRVFPYQSAVAFVEFDAAEKVPSMVMVTLGSAEVQFDLIGEETDLGLGEDAVSDISAASISTSSSAVQRVSTGAQSPPVPEPFFAHITPAQPAIPVSDVLITQADLVSLPCLDPGQRCCATVKDSKTGAPRQCRNRTRRISSDGVRCWRHQDVHLFPAVTLLR